MPRLILFAGIVALLAAGAVWLANDPGSVSMTWRGWQVETSVGVLVTVVLVAVVVILLIARLIAFLGGRLQAFTSARRERRFKRGLVSLGDGFAAVQAGQAMAAKKLAKDASKLLGDNPAVLLLRKDAAVLNGDAGEVQEAAEVQEQLDLPLQGMVLLGH